MQERKNTVAQLLVKYLEERKVRHVFGLCGHTNIAVLSALHDSSIEFITVRHEQIAAHAADAYARVSSRAAVFLSHLTPGLSNGTTGVLNAALDCIPMVVIAGDIPTHYYGKHAHQEVNLHADASQYEIYKPFVKRAWRVESAELFPEIIEKAFLLAESGQQGPVLVNVPMNVFSTEINPQLFERLTGAKQLSKPCISYEIAEEIVETLARAKCPVIYAGGGVLLAKASHELEEFVNHTNTPVAYSLMGKGCIPDTHPFAMGMTGFWGTSLVNQSCLNADYVFALGTRFKEADCSSWENGYTFNIPYSTKLIHIDIEASEIGRNYPAHIGAIGDLKLSLTLINKIFKERYPSGLKNEAAAERIENFKREFKQSIQAETESASFPMMPERILADTRAVLPDDAIITTDVGWNKNGIGQQFDILTPNSILTPGGCATMGFGPPAAIGAKLAAPSKLVVSMVGDGGFGQNPAVLSTARELDIQVIWIVMNNNAFGTIAGLQKAHYGITYGTLFEHAQTNRRSDTNYADIAKAYGIEGIRITEASEFKTALINALASEKSTVIDVPMKNNPTPTTGHWNILDIYSPDEKVSHSTTD